MIPVSNNEYLEKIFSKLDLSSARIDNTIFEACNFENCNLTSAQFIGCKFANCTFHHCNISLVIISNSRFYEISFNECKLIGIDWTQAYWPTFNLCSELYFNKSILTNSSFLGLKLNHLKMVNCRLNDIDFRESDLSNSEIIDCDLSGSLFNKTNLNSTNFTDSWGFNINILENSINKAKFSRQEAVILLESLGIELVD